MKTFITLAFLALSTAGSAQSLSIAPTSFQAWGVTPHMASVTFEFREVGLHLVFPYKESADKFGSKTRSAFGLSWKPLVVEDIVKAGIILFHRPFPTENAQRFHFLLNLGYDFSSFRLSYEHVSNLGIGSAAFNPGMDLLKLTVYL